MQQQLPFRFQEVFKLTNLGLNPQLFKFGNLSFESQKYICVKDGGQCAIIDTSQNFKIDRKDMAAEGIVMHPERNVLAVRATKGESTIIQIFDMDAGKKLKQAEIREPVTYWRWINNDNLAAIAKVGVYHININNQDGAQKMFDRASAMANCNIMSYNVDANSNWCTLIGLYSPDQKNINAQMMLYNHQRKQQQILEGFASCFTQMPVAQNNLTYKNELLCFCEKKAADGVNKLHIMEIGNPAPGEGKFKVTVDIQMAPDAPGDFPVLMQDCQKYGLVFMITKFGYFYMYEVSKGALVYRQRITDQLVFCAAKNKQTDGMICINKAGQILAINVEDQNLVKFVANAQHIPDAKALSFRMAQRFNLSGADEIFQAQFNQCVISGDFAGAAKVAAGSPGDLIRNQETINKFKALPQTGGPQPILIYFSTLLESVQLNAIESVELVRPVLMQGKTNLVEDWVKNNKLTMTDELGDLIKQYNPQMALKIYQNSGSPDKVIQGLIEANQFDKIVPYCQQTGHKPDFMKILRAVMPSNPQAAVGLAKMITARDASGMPKTPLDGVVQVFLENNRIQETTAFLLEALKGNRADEGHLQTKLFEINLMSAPNVAEGIFQLNIFTHYDRERIAKLCEQVNLFGRALQNYTQIADRKRVMMNAHAIPEEQMIEAFANFSEEDSIASMHDLLRVNRANGMLVAKIAVKYSSKIDTKKSIEVLESFGTNDGLLYFLCNVLPHTDDPDIYFKYIEACARMNNMKEVERVVKDTTFYDPVRVKDFLKEGKFADPRPLIYLCDKHGYIDELTRYLYTTKQMRCIEIYLFKVNSNATPQVLGALIDMDCDETQIKVLLKHIRICPIGELVENFETRGKLRMLQEWLEDRHNERNQEPELHNALAKIYIDINKDPQDFLIKNQFYDSKIVGKYCEERNPDLAFTAYKRAWGSCDEELIEVTNRNYLFRKQARYLVERQSPELWASVLNPENPHRKNVIDQVVQTALPETKNVDEVSNTVKAFIDAELPNELIELLERIVLHNSDFASNKSLQNLLILTAIRSDTNRVMDYVNRLDNYEGVQLANIALEDQHKLYDEALAIFKKFGEHVEAVKVLIQHLQNIQSATEYAEKINQPAVWSEIGKAQVDNGQLKEAIDAFIKANDPSMFERLILLAQNTNEYDDLVPFLLMARQTLKEQKVDSELIFAYAKCGARMLPDLENFISDPNQADLQRCGDRCFDERLFEAAELIFKRIGNQQKLAQVYVKMKQFPAAFEAAKKANVPKVWKAVCFACVRAQEFRTASLCGLHIIVLPDHLEELIDFYEKFGYIDELVQLLEQGMSLENTHNGIFTDLGILYAKYQPQRLMDHIRAYTQRIMIPKLIRACEQYQMWAEATHLHSAYDQWDQAIITMMEHSPSAWRHDQFSLNITKVSNHDLWYRAMIFYLEEEPMLLNDLLKLLANKIDLTKTTQVIKRTGHIALITPFLKSVQNQNIAAVNEALNEIYLQNEDYESLRTSIKEYDSFELTALAADLETHELLECRRIAALLYRKNKKFQKSIEISKKDDLHKDAMETVAESKDAAMAEDLLRHIMNMEDKELLAAMLYTCYDLIKPDVALEMAWRCGLQEYVMPYFIQFVADLSKRVETVQKSTDDIKKKEEQKNEEAMNRPLDIGVDFMFPNMAQQMQPQNLAIMPAMGGMNMHQQF